MWLTNSTGLVRLRRKSILSEEARQTATGRQVEPGESPRPWLHQVSALSVGGTSMESKPGPFEQRASSDFLYRSNWPIHRLNTSQPLPGSPDSPVTVVKCMFTNWLTSGCQVKSVTKRILHQNPPCDFFGWVSDRVFHANYCRSLQPASDPSNRKKVFRAELSTSLIIQQLPSASRNYSRQVT